jgi:hypothetical protein
MKHDALLQAIDNFIALASKVYGPYANGPDGRQIVIIKEDDGSSRTVSYPKYIMEQHLGRKLDENEETTDHLDFDFNNNDINNLRLVPRKEHSGDDTRRVKLLKLNCPMCLKDFERSPRLVRDKSKKGKVSAFCSRVCAGRYSRQVQLGLRERMLVPEPPASEYYRRKNVQAIFDYLITKYG